VALLSRLRTRTILWTGSRTCRGVTLDLIVLLLSTFLEIKPLMFYSVVLLFPP
jgi:hypothetical protein